MNNTPQFMYFLKRHYLTSLENCDDTYSPEGLWEFVKLLQTTIKFRKLFYIFPLMSSYAITNSIFWDSQIVLMLTFRIFCIAKKWRYRYQEVPGVLKPSFILHCFLAPLIQFHDSKCLKIWSVCCPNAVGSLVKDLTLFIAKYVYKILIPLSLHYSFESRLMQ